MPIGSVGLCVRSSIYLIGPFQNDNAESPANVLCDVKSVLVAGVSF